MQRKNKADNLKPFKTDQSREEAKKNGKKGGIASGEARRKKKSFAEIAKDLGDCKITEKSVLAQFSAFGVTDKDGLALNTAIVAGQAIAGLRGNTKAAEWLRNLLENEKKSKEDDRLETERLELENERLRLENEKLRKEIEKMNNGENREVEDLTVISELLGMRNDTDT